MDEVIVRLARAIASRLRLRILSHLAERDEATPTAVAGDLGVPLSSLSTCLRILSSVGLIRGRRSGARCYYSFTSPYREQALSGGMSRWLRRVLSTRGEKDNRGLLEVRDSSNADPQASLHAGIFQAATAFTDLRRLQIMRYLKTHGQATGEELVTKLSMSPDAVTRHTAKLRRRGFLSVKRRQGRRKAFQLAGRYKTPVHREMFRVVVGAWKKAKSRTSRSPRFRSPEIPCPVPAGAHRTIYDRSCSPKEFRRFLMHMGL